MMPSEAKKKPSQFVVGNPCSSSGGLVVHPARTFLPCSGGEWRCGERPLNLGGSCRKVTAVCAQSKCEGFRVRRKSDEAPPA